MNLPAHMQRVFAPLEVHLSQSILFLDEPSAWLLASWPGADACESSPDEAAEAPSPPAPLHGLDYLLGPVGVRNVLGLERVWAEMDDAEEESCTNDDPYDGRASRTPHAEASASNGDASLGWSNPVDLIDAEAVEEKKSVPSPSPASAFTVSVPSTASPSVPSPSSAPSPSPRLLTVLPLDSSFAHVDDEDVLQMLHAESEALAANAPNSRLETTKQEANSKAAADEWAWNDEDDENESKQASKPAQSVKTAVSILPRAVASSSSSKPGEPVRAPSKACFFLSGPLLPPLLSRLAGLIARTRCEASPFCPPALASPSFLQELHLFTPVSENAHLDHPQVGQGFEALQAQLAQRVREERCRARQEEVRAAAESPLRVSIHHFPLSFTMLSPNTFLAPASVPSSPDKPVSLSSYPLSLHAPSSFLSLPSSLLTAAPAVATSGSSLLSGFSVTDALSNLSKGLSEHIREAEMIAMQGAEPKHLQQAKQVGAIPATGGSFSGATDSLLASLSHALANALLSLRLQPDIFALGPQTSELAKATLAQLHELKKQSAVAEALAAEEADEAWRTHKKKGRNAGAPPKVPPTPTPPAWSSASLVLVDRSLDLLSVSRHHSPAASVRDRIHDEQIRTDAASFTAVAPLSDADIAARLLDMPVDDDAMLMPEMKDLPWHPEQVREQMFARKHADSEDGPLLSMQTRESLFPAASSSPFTRSLLSKLDGVASTEADVAAGVGASSASVKAVLSVLQKQLTKLLSSCGLPAPVAASASGPPSSSQLTQACRSILSVFDNHREHRFKHREVLELAHAILRTCLRPAASASWSQQPSLYDRILAFEQMLLVHYISNVSSLPTSGGSNPNEDENSLALQGLVQMLVEFVEGINNPSEETVVSAKKDSSKNPPHSSSAPSDRLSLSDLLRLFVFLYSLVGGKHVVPEQQARQLKDLLRASFATASAHERAWLLRAGGIREEPTESSNANAFEQLIDAFFERLQAVSVARINLSAADLIDLCAPLESVSLESEDSASSTPAFHPFVRRLLGRIFDSSCLLDDLEHFPFDERTANDEKKAAAAEAETEKEHGTKNAHSTPADTNPPSSLPASSIDSVVSPSAAPSWSFLGSLASVVSSVAQSASGNLATLGFRGEASRPGQGPHARTLILFFVGGITHAEARQAAAMGEAWAHRAQAEEAAQGNEAHSSPLGALPRTFLVGSTHIATARELVNQMIRAR